MLWSEPWNGKASLLPDQNNMKVFEPIIHTDVYIISSVYIVSYVLIDVLTDFPGKPVFHFEAVCDRVDNVFFPCAQHQSSQLMTLDCLR